MIGDPFEIPTDAGELDRPGQSDRVALLGQITVEVATALIDFVIGLVEPAP